MILISKNNPLLKETAALKDKKKRRELGLFLVEGEKMCSEVKASGMEIERVFVSEDYDGNYPFEAEPVRLSNEAFRFLSDEVTPQGILCRVKIPESSVKSPKYSCLFLDGVSDPGNLGTIIRTANAAGYRELYLANCTDPYSPKCVRASMSGVFFTELNIGSREEILSVLSGTPIIAADMFGENVFNYLPPEKFVLAIGNEANGISAETFSAASARIKIPMEPTQESLNAAVSAGIAMYLLKQNQFKKI